MDKITNYVEGKALEKVVKVCLGLGIDTQTSDQTNKQGQINFDFYDLKVHTTLAWHKKWWLGLFKEAFGYYT